MEQAIDHLEGFTELLEASGRTLVTGQESFRALVRTLRPKSDSFDLSPTDNDTVLVSALRDTAPASAVRVGASLSDEQGFCYRVTRLHRSPNRAIVQMECVVVNP